MSQTDEPCGRLDLGCNLGNAAGAAMGNAITELAESIMEMFGKVVASLGTVWVGIGTPNLTTTGGASDVTGVGPGRLLRS